MHASQIVYEAIANIRTVASLSLEERMGNLFVEKIQAPHKYVNLHVCNLSLSLSNCIIIIYEHIAFLLHPIGSQCAILYSLDL